MNRIAAQTIIESQIAEMPPTPPLTESIALYQNLIAQKAIDPTRISMKAFLNRLARGENSRLEALHLARNKRERIVLLKEYRQELANAEYSQLVKDARNEGAITPRTLLEMRQKETL